MTGKPIKFLGAGEKIDALEPFHPERIASRILGMGDVVSLVEEVERKVDREEAGKLARKLQQGQEASIWPICAISWRRWSSWGAGALMDKLPMGVPKGVDAALGERQLRRQMAVIDSMTPRERRFPK